MTAWPKPLLPLQSLIYSLRFNIYYDPGTELWDCLLWEGLSEDSNVYLFASPKKKIQKWHVTDSHMI